MANEIDYSGVEHLLSKPSTSKSSGDIDYSSVAHLLGDKPVAKPQETSTIGEYGTMLKEGVKGIPAYIAQAVEGDTPYSKPFAKDYQAERKADEQSYIESANADAPVLGGLAKAREIREAAPSMSGSIAGLAPSLAGAATGAAIGSVVPVLGTAVGGVVGGIAGGIGGLGMMKRSAENQFVKQNIDKANADRESKGLPLLTQQESIDLQNSINASGDTAKIGYSEALPETAGNLAEMALMATPLGKAGKTAAVLASPLKRAAITAGAKALGVMGTELGEEEITRQLQNPIMTDRGFPEQGMADTAKQTAISVLPMAALGLGGGAYQGYKEAKANNSTVLPVTSTIDDPEILSATELHAQARTKADNLAQQAATAAQDNHPDSAIFAKQAQQAQEAADIHSDGLDALARRKAPIIDNTVSPEGNNVNDYTSAFDNPEAKAASDLHDTNLINLSAAQQAYDNSTGLTASVNAGILEQAKEAAKVSRESLTTAQGLQDGTIAPIQPEPVAPSTLPKITPDVHAHISNVLDSAYQDFIKKGEKSLNAGAIQSAANDLGVSYDAQKEPLGQILDKTRKALQNYNIANIDPVAIEHAQDTIAKINEKAAQGLPPTNVDNYNLSVAAEKLGTKPDLNALQSTIDLHSQLNAKPAPENTTSPTTTNPLADGSTESSLQSDSNAGVTSETESAPVGKADTAKPATPKWIEKQADSDVIKNPNNFGNLSFKNTQEANDFIATHRLKNHSPAKDGYGGYEIHSKKFSEANKVKENSDIPDALKPSGEYHSAIESLAKDLQVKGGTVVDKEGKRSPSVNPTWFKDGQFIIGDNKTPESVAGIKLAVHKYKNNLKLTDKDHSILQKLSDIATDMESENKDNSVSDVENEDTRSDEVKSAHKFIDEYENGDYDQEQSIGQDLLHARAIDNNINPEGYRNDTGTYDNSQIYKELKRKTGYNNTNNAADTQPNTAQSESPRTGENTSNSDNNGTQPQETVSNDTINQPTNKAQNGEGTDTTTQTTEKEVDEATTRNSKPDEEKTSEQGGVLQTATSEKDAVQNKGETTAKVGQDTVSPDNVEQSEGIDTLTDELKQYLVDKGIFTAQKRNGKWTALIANPDLPRFLTDHQINSLIQQVKQDVSPDKTANKVFNELGFDSNKIKAINTLSNALAFTAEYRIRNEHLIKQSVIELQAMRDNGDISEDEFNTLTADAFENNQVITKELQAAISAINNDAKNAGLGDWVKKGKSDYIVHVQPLNSTRKRLKSEASSEIKGLSAKELSDKIKSSRQNIGLIERTMEQLKKLFHKLFSSSKNIANENTFEPIKWLSDDGKTMFTVQKAPKTFVFFSDEQLASPDKIAQANELKANIKALKSDDLKVSKTSTNVSGKLDGATFDFDDSLLGNNPYLKTINRVVNHEDKRVPLKGFDDISPDNIPDFISANDTEIKLLESALLSAKKGISDQKNITSKVARQGATATIKLLMAHKKSGEGEAITHHYRGLELTIYSDNGADYLKIGESTAFEININEPTKVSALTPKIDTRIDSLAKKDFVGESKVVSEQIAEVKQTKRELAQILADAGFEQYKTDQAKKAQESRWINQQAEQEKPEPDAGKLDLESKIRKSIKKNGTLHKDTQTLGREYMSSYGKDEFSNFAKALSDKGLMNYKGADNGWHDNTLRDGNGGEVRSLRKFYSTNHKGAVEVSAYFDDDAEMYTPDGTESEPNNAKLFVIKGHYADRYRLTNVDIDTVDDIASKLSKYRQSNSGGSSKDETAFLLSIGFKSGRFGYNSTFDGNNNGQDPDVEVTPDVKPDKPSGDVQQSADKYDQTYAEDIIPNSKEAIDAAKDLFKSSGIEQGDFDLSIDEVNYLEDILGGMSLGGKNGGIGGYDITRLMSLLDIPKSIKNKLIKDNKFFKNLTAVSEKIFELLGNKDKKANEDKLIAQAKRVTLEQDEDIFSAYRLYSFALDELKDKLEEIKAFPHARLTTKVARSHIAKEKKRVLDLMRFYTPSKPTPADKPVNQTNGDVAKSDMDKSYAQEMADLKAQMGDAIGNALSIIGGKMNMTEEDESKLLPIMAKIFRIAAKMIQLRFSRPANFEESAGYVMQQIRELADKESADKFTIQHLRGGYASNGGEDFEGMAKHKSTAELEAAYAKYVDGLINKAKGDIKAEKANSNLVEKDQVKPKTPRTKKQVEHAENVLDQSGVTGDLFAFVDESANLVNNGTVTPEAIHAAQTVEDLDNVLATALVEAKATGADNANQRTEVESTSTIEENVPVGAIAQARNQTATQKPTHTLTTIDGESIPVYENDDGMWQSVAKNEDGYYQEFPKDDDQIDGVKVISEDTNTITLDGKEIAVADVFKQLKGKAAERNQITELLNNHPDKQMVARIMAINEGVGTKNRTELPILEALVKLGRYSKENPRGFSMDC